MFADGEYGTGEVIFHPTSASLLWFLSLDPARFFLTHSAVRYSCHASLNVSVTRFFSFFWFLLRTLQALHLSWWQGLRAEQ